MRKAAPRKFLGIYLNDHLAYASGATELARRTAHAHRDAADAKQLTGLAADIAADHKALLSIMRRLGTPARRYKSLAGWAAEKVGRLKLNGQLLSRSPLSDLVELDGLLSGVQGKAAGWRTLLAVADREPKLDPAQLRRLLKRADAQVAQLEKLRRASARQLYRLAKNAKNARNGSPAAR